jgi:hypothetical protein
MDRIVPAKLKDDDQATAALARSHVDFTGFQRRILEVEENRLMPRDVEAQFIAAATDIGLRVEPKADGLWRIKHVLAEVRSARLRSVERLRKAKARADRERLRVVAQALAGTALAGKEDNGPDPTVATTGAEQAALKKLVANWRAQIDERLAMDEGTSFDTSGQ